jgi:decaprenyl-phosphate phosphoribosyltransferase
METAISKKSSLTVIIRQYLKLLRVSQWVKNLFVFLPLFFSLRIIQLDLLVWTFDAFVAFCLVSSAVYILNDLRDIEADRLHPKKKYRPVASGSISRAAAIIAMLSLLFPGLMISWLFGPTMLALVLLYVFLNMAYSMKLKHIPIIDISIIAAGFVIRIFVGGVATDTKIYLWIIIMTFLLALFIALAKRRDDVIIYMETDTKVRKVVDGYNLTFIDSAMMIMAAVIIVSYIMYTVSPDVVAKFNSGNLYLTTAFVILGILRFMQITYVENNSGSPTEILLKDRFIQYALAGWIVSFAIIIYRANG